MPLLLLLIGLPGSGKTKLAKDLVTHAAAAAEEFRAAASDDADDHYDADYDSVEEEENQAAAAAAAAATRRSPRGKPRRWIRVCPDAPRGGTNATVLAAAARALASGSCVVVDRTNLTAGQRSPLLALARERGAEAHALYLNRDRRECLDRAYLRADHEAGVRGKVAVLAVQRMAGAPRDVPREGPPPDGFARVRELLCDAAQDAAAEEYGRGGGARGRGAGEGPGRGGARGRSTGEGRATAGGGGGGGGAGGGPEAPPPLPLLPPEEAARALAAPLACHRCGSAMKNMPTLRAHLEEHERGTK